MNEALVAGAEAPVTWPCRCRLAPFGSPTLDEFDPDCRIHRPDAFDLFGPGGAFIERQEVKACV